MTSVLLPIRPKPKSKKGQLARLENSRVDLAKKLDQVQEETLLNVIVSCLSLTLHNLIKL